MDFLLEMTPGTGWLARENNRVVFMPEDVSVDVAHDVIEPLLVPREVNEAFSTLDSWLSSSRPLPPVLLIGLDGTPRVTNHGVTGFEQHSTEMMYNDAANAASGMLIEGVIRAGGFRVHLHSNATARTSQQVKLNPTPSILQLHLDEYSVEVGQGIVIGRWPYKHPDFNPNLEPLILADAAVSRLHAEVLPQGTGAIVIDRKSHNGTWVASRSGGRTRLEPNVAHTLHDGDRILLGDTEITLGGGGPSA
jgi:hypothetical protein